MVLGEHSVVFRVQVHVFQFAAVKVVHGRVVERHEIVGGQSDGIPGNVQSSVQVVYVVRDIVADGDLLDSCDFIGDFLGEPVELSSSTLVLATILLLLLLLLLLSLLLSLLV